MPALHLVLAVDRKHVVGCATTILSLLDHASPGRPLRFHVAADGLRNRECDGLRTVVATSGLEATIDFWRFDRGRVRHLARSKIVSHASYARLFIGEILPAGVRRCIYLDSDLLFGRDVTELWDQPLDGVTVGAVENLDAAEQAQHQRRLGLRSPRYLNAGVLLVDMERWHARHVRDRALAEAERVGDHLILHDQDALNCALQDDWKAIPPHWNVAVADRALRADSEAVFHFMGAPKPWELDYAGRFAEKYASYVQRTPFVVRRSWDPIGIGRVIARAKRRIPYLPGALRMLRSALRGRAS